MKHVVPCRNIGGHAPPLLIPPRNRCPCLLSPGNVVKCFVFVHCKTLSRPRRITYALFSQPVVGFWRLCPQTHTGTPSLDPAGRLSYQTSNFPTLEKNPMGAHDQTSDFKAKMH